MSAAVANSSGIARHKDTPRPDPCSGREYFNTVTGRRAEFIGWHREGDDVMYDMQSCTGKRKQFSISQREFDEDWEREPL